SNVVVGGVIGVLILTLSVVFTMQAWAKETATLAVAAVTAAPAVFDTPMNSSPIALSANKQHIWVVNPDDDSVSVIGDLDNNPHVIAKIGVGDEPQSVALGVNALDDTKYYVYVANAADNSVSIINVTASTPTSITTTPFGRPEKTIVTGAEPWNIVASPDAKRVFVANSAQDTITVIRADSRTVVGNVDLRNSICNDPDRNRVFQPRGLAVTLNNDRLYVTRFLSFTKEGGTQGADDGKEGVVCELNIPADVATLPTVAGVVKLGSQDTGFNIDANGDGTPDPTRAFPNQMQSIVIRDNQAYLPNIAASPSKPLKFNVDTQAFVNVIDNAATGTPTDASANKFINMHLGARDPEPDKTKLFFANPWAIAFTTQSGTGNAYAVSAGSDLLVKLNVDATGALSFTVDANTTRYIDLNNPEDPATADANAGKNPLDAAKWFREALNFLCEYSMAQGYDYKFALEPKPNEPRGDIYLPTVGSMLGFIYSLDHPDMVGLNPEVAHDTMAGLNFMHAVAQAYDAGKLFHIDLNDQNPGRYDQDFRFGSHNIKQNFFLVKFLEDVGYDGSRHFDAHAYRSSDDADIKEFAKGCMRTYMIFKEKSAQFNQDAEIQALLAEITANDGSMDRFGGSYSTEKANALKAHSFDRVAMGQKGQPYERLDQLVIDLLLGVR
ncbi:MAG: beta-propeller fold lactonase family protein, partial [Caldilineaceae bacterium]|nr:beta-propeller fold lactonase family protein [Caldilineaceae bacterium]